MIEVKEKINENEKNVINVANLINKNVLSFYNMIYRSYKYNELED